MKMTLYALKRRIFLSSRFIANIKKACLKHAFLIN